MRSQSPWTSMVLIALGVAGWWLLVALAHPEARPRMSVFAGAATLLGVVLMILMIWQPKWIKQKKYRA